MGNVIHNPERIKAKIFGTLLIALILLGSCSQPKYNIIVFNGMAEVLFFKLGGKEISVDYENFRYLGAFKKDNYDWSATIGTSSFGGTVYLDQDRNFILYGKLNGEYLYEWR